MSVALVANLLFARRRYRFPRTLRGWIGIGLLIAVMPTLSKLSYYLPVNSSHRAILSELFHLPDSVAYEYFRSSSKMRATRPQIEAVVRFTPEAFTDYFTRLDDGRIWKPVPIPYDGTTIYGEYTDEALAWTRQQPIFAGSRRARWGNGTREKFYAIKDGRFFCLAVQRLEADRSPYSDGRLVYRGAACHQIARNEGTLAYVLGAIDYDTRTLLMYVN